MADETDEASFGLREFQGGHPRAGDRPQDITTNRHATRYSRRRGGSPAAVSIAAAVTVQAQAGYRRGREARPRAGCSRRRGGIAEGVGGFTARQRTFGSLAFGLSFLLSSRSFDPRSFAFWHFGSGCFAFGIVCSRFLAFRFLLVPALSPFAFFFSRSFTFAGSQGARSSGLPSSGLAALLVRGESASSMDRGALPVSETGVERRVRQASSAE